MEIVLYSTHCPRCSVLEKKLKKKNLHYTEINDVDKMLAMGLKSTPVLQIDGGVLMNFQEANEWINAQEG